MRRPDYLLVVLVALLSIGLGLSAIARHPVIQVARATVIDKITLSGCVMVTPPCRVAGWNGTTTMQNPTITVHQGDNVSLILTTNDTSAHQFQFDADNDGAADTADCPATDPCSNVIPTGGTVKYSFIENAPPFNNYIYFCIFHPSAMRGTFVVLATSVGATIPPQKMSSSIIPSVVLVSILLLTLLAAAALYSGRLDRNRPTE